MDNNQKKTLNRRDFLKMGGMGVAVLATSSLTKAASAAEQSLKGKKFAMVIDLQKCVGCGGCMISCKNENNVQEGFAWSFKDIRTTGRFPNVRYEYIPRLCNHCDNAPCVEICPTPSMHKEEGGITANDPETCIGCRQCMEACPYTTDDGGVISFNETKTHRFWQSEEELIKGATESPKQVVNKTKGTAIPYYNPDRETFRKGSGLRKEGVVEKCTFCDHRLKQGKQPYCVVRCPSGARVFGDLNDPNSKVNKILGKYRPMRLKEHLGTEPKIYYVRDFNPGVYETLEERHKEMSVAD